MHDYRRYESLPTRKQPVLITTGREDRRNRRKAERKLNKIGYGIK